MGDDVVRPVDERDAALLVRRVLLDGRRVDVRCRSGVVEKISTNLEPEDHEEVIEAAGLAAVPPYVNGHTHAAMTLFRSFGDDLPLMQWLREVIWPAEKQLDEEDVYWGTRLAAVEMLRAGVTHFFDMYWHGEAVARAAADAGIRATVSAVLIETDDAMRLRDEAEKSLEEIAQVGGTVRPSLGPHAIYTVSAENLEWTAQLAEQAGVPVHIHLSETRGEVEDCLAKYSLRPAELLERVGLLGEHVLLAHGCWLDDRELELVAERGATVVTNPTSNLKLATGRHFPYRRAAELGVRVGLGTDGAASNNSLDLGEATKIFALVQKFDTDDTTVATAKEVLEIARGFRSPLMGGGPIREGEKADFVLVDLDQPEMVPGDLDVNLVYASATRCVHTVVVAGRPLVRSGCVRDSAEIVREVRRRAAKLRGD